MGISGAITAWRQAAKPPSGLRFHDLRHQAITELAESGAPDATTMALEGNLSRKMLEHYSHIRMAAKRDALEKALRCPDHASRAAAEPRVGNTPVGGYVTMHVTKGQL